MKALKHGWKRIPHAEKMARKAAFREEVDKRVKLSPELQKKREQFCGYWRWIAAMHGVGRRPDPAPGPYDYLKVAA